MHSVAQSEASLVFGCQSVSNHFIAIWEKSRKCAWPVDFQALAAASNNSEGLYLYKPSTPG